MKIESKKLKSENMKKISQEKFEKIWGSTVNILDFSLEWDLKNLERVRDLEPDNEETRKWYEETRTEIINRRRDLIKDIKYILKVYEQDYVK